MAELVHQIWHGNSIELVKKFKPGRVQSVITDPPFGVANLSKQAVTAEGKMYARKIANDESPEVAIQVFRDVMTNLMPAMKPESDFYVFTAGQVLAEWILFTREFFAQFDYKAKAVMPWAKPSPGMGDTESWGQAIEYILYFKRGDRKARQDRVNGFFTDSTIPASKLLHPHEKPIPLLRRLIEHSTDAGDFLVDPFGGSGSLVRAAKTCGRSAVAIELDKMNWQLASEALANHEGAGLFG